jgi:hypothetical protein
LRRRRFNPVVVADIVRAFVVIDVFEGRGDATY